MAPSVGHSVYGRSKGGSDVLVKSDCVGMSGWKDRLNTRQRRRPLLESCLKSNLIPTYRQSIFNIVGHFMPSGRNDCIVTEKLVRNQY